MLSAKGWRRHTPRLSRTSSSSGWRAAAPWRAPRRFVDGSLDAMFDTAIYPAGSVAMATSAGAHLLPVGGPAIERLRRDYPFFRAAVIPRNTYDGVDGAVRTIGVDSLLICSRD